MSFFFAVPLKCYIIISKPITKYPPGHCENALLLLHIRCPYAQHPADGPSEEFLFRCYPRNVLLEHREEFFISMIPTRCPYGTLERVFYFGLPTRCPYGTSERVFDFGLPTRCPYGKFRRFFSFRVTHEMSLWDIWKIFFISCYPRDVPMGH